MGLRILEGKLINEDGRIGAVMYCSTTNWAFGNVFEDAQQIERFLTWLRYRGISDPRSLPNDKLETITGEFFAEDNAEEVADNDHRSCR